MDQVGNVAATGSGHKTASGSEWSGQIGLRGGVYNVIIDISNRIAYSVRGNLHNSPGFMSAARDPRLIASEELDTSACVWRGEFPDGKSRACSAFKPGWGNNRRPRISVYPWREEPESVWNCHLSLRVNGQAGRLAERGDFSHLERGNPDGLKRSVSM
ncbi:hypothetical protein P4O66_008253 [Electrophorus voltai]|uniref:Uncharacterized protein n=1 Tax=Electrophorus voltai TaxID=2609070 RepID=A0AAD8ZG55_9TELE|nr:hypothetical protein P4O66_008253 [Electrophorus voltai]